jgi:hypothetical protein
MSSWLHVASVCAAEPDTDNSAPQVVVPEVAAPQVEARPTPVAKAGWNRHTSQKRKFVVLVPASTQKIQVQDGDRVDITIFKGSTSAYMVSYGSLSAYGASKESISSDNADRLIQSSVEGLVKGFSKGSPAKLKSTKKITLQGQPGQESFIVNVEAGVQAKVRSFYVNKQMYQVSVVASGKSFPLKNADVFLNSFTLLK